MNKHMERFQSVLIVDRGDGFLLTDDPYEDNPTDGTRKRGDAEPLKVP